MNKENTRVSVHSFIFHHFSFFLQSQWKHHGRSSLNFPHTVLLHGIYGLNDSAAGGSAL